MGGTKRVPTPAADAAASARPETAAPATEGADVARVAEEASALATAPGGEANSTNDQADIGMVTGELTECRVLLAFDGYDANDVIELDADELARLERSNHVDSDEAAVAYAKSLLA